MKNYKKFNLVGLITISIFFVGLLNPTVSANGAVMIGNYNEHVYIPSQKAAIFWDGTNETMILSTKIATNNLTNLAWVIPIPSNNKPEIEEGEIQVFYDLAEVFWPNVLKYRYNDWEEYYNEKGVQVIESKKIDIYDITILKATNATILVEWLNENEYVISEETIPVLQDYCDKEDFWFVANKINLENKYGNLTRFLSYIEVDNPLEISNCLTYPIESFTVPLICGNVPNCIKIYEDLGIIDTDEFTNLTNKYEVDNETLDLFCSECSGGDGKLLWWFFVSTNIDVNDEASSERQGWCKSDDYPEDTYCIFVTSNELEEWGTTIDELRNKIMSNMDFISEFKNKTNEVKNNRKESSVIDKLQNISDMYYTLQYLNQGIATPLKFVFQPNEPFYPMKISSINEGNTNISVYVFSETPVKDKNDILSIYEMTNASPLKEDYNLTTQEYITLLKYIGNLKDLTEDSIFVSTDYNSSIDPKSSDYTLISDDSKLKEDDSSSGKDKGIPGFELIAILISIGIIFYLKKRIY